MSTRNEQLFERAQRTIPGGVNSPVRAFRSVGGTPRFFTRGVGSRLWDADGTEYIDYVGSWGPAILGHAHPAIVEAVGSRIEVWMDGGIRSGQDVLKAIAMGAKGTYIGRAMLYGLGAMGEAGVTKALEIIHRELDLSMAFCGRTQISAVDKSILLPGTFPLPTAA